MSKARELSQRAGVDGALSNRNMVINGNFSVWQRGTSASGLTTGQVFVADRWSTTSSGGYTNISRQEFSNGQTDVPNASYFLRHDIATAPDYVHIDHRVEDLRRFDGQTVTASFWAKASSNMTLGFEFVSGHGVGGTVEVNGNYAPYNKGSFAVTTAWQKFTATVTTTSLAGKSLGASHCFITRFIPSSGSAYRSRWGGQSFVGQFDLAQVQLEYGDTVTPFEHRSFTDTLQACQRYYQFNGSEQGRSSPAGDRAAFALHFSPEMRAAPTITLVNSTNAIDDMYTSQRSVTGVTGTYGRATTQGIGVEFSCSTTGNKGHSLFSKTISFDAEL